MAKLLTHSFTSPLRYPGGKGGLANYIKQVIEKNALFDGHYVEPFAGGAGIAWSLLFEEYVSHVHVNDLDRSIYSFWIAVLQHTEEICRLIYDTRVTMRQWHEQRYIQQNPDKFDLMELGFSTFFLNRTNRSGIIKAGVIGGKNQSGKWKLDARFNKNDLIKRIQRIARYKNRVSVYCLDGMEFIDTVLVRLPIKSLVYLDPPYYVKGKQLYQNHYSHSDHVNLSKIILTKIIQPWVVSYDAVPEICSMYNSQQQLSYYLSYSAQERYAGREVMFFSDSMELPDVESSLISSRSKRMPS